MNGDFTIRGQSKHFAFVRFSFGSRFIATPYSLPVTAHIPLTVVNGGHTESYQLCSQEYRPRMEPRSCFLTGCLSGVDACCSSRPVRKVFYVPVLRRRAESLLTFDAPTE